MFNFNNQNYEKYIGIIFIVVVDNNLFRMFRIKCRRLKGGLSCRKKMRKANIGILLIPKEILL